MSLVTELFEGKITPAQFVEDAVADVKKDLAWAQGLPFAVQLEEWAVGALGSVLATKLSPTVAALIVAEVKKLLSLPS